MDSQLVLFDLGSKNFGVDVGSVERVGRIPEIYKKSNSPLFIEGYTNFRGCEMPIIDLHKWFGMTPQEIIEESRIIVTSICGVKIGMIVSAVTDVIYIDKSNIEPPTTVEKKDHILGVTRVKNTLLTIVDLESVLSLDEKVQLNYCQNTLY